MTGDTVRELLAVLDFLPIILAVSSPGAVASDSVNIIPITRIGVDCDKSVVAHATAECTCTRIEDAFWSRPRRWARPVIFLPRWRLVYKLGILLSTSGVAVMLDRHHDPEWVQIFTRAGRDWNSTTT